MRTFFILPLFAILAAAETVHVSLPLRTDVAGVWHLSNAFADVPQGAASPKLISTPQPPATKTVARAFVSVSFQIDERGRPFNIQIDKSSDKELDDEVIAMIREWRFEAALSGGFAVQSRASINLSIGQLPPGPRPVRRIFRNN
jgi:TonB family protein